MKTKTRYTEIRYFDFDFNLAEIKKITSDFNFYFNYYFPYITCVNLACFEEHSSDILEKIKKLELDKKNNLLIFYGKLLEAYNGDGHIRFLKSNDLYSGRCLWANNPHLIIPVLRMADLIKI